MISWPSVFSVRVLRSFSRLFSTTPIPKLEYETRRSKLAEKITQSCFFDQVSSSHHLVIVPAAEVQYCSPHVPTQFRQDSYFRYITGITEPNAVFVLEVESKSPGNLVSTPRLFVEVRDSRNELWDGPTLGVDGATRFTGISSTMPLNLFPDYLQVALSDLCTSGGILWFSTPFVIKSKERAPFNRSIYSIVLDKFNEVQSTRTSLRNPNPIIDELRLIKSQSELLLMKRAVEVTSKALKRTLATAYPGIREAELAARFEFESTLMGSTLGYPAVVAGGDRANIIHYLKNSECVEDGQLVLMDVGCEVEGYTADISRTWPINGKRE